MNRWTVYEYAKKYYHQNNRAPSRILLAYEFPNILKDEIEEGLMEFELMLRRAGDEVQLERSNFNAVV